MGATALWRVEVDGDVRLARGSVESGPSELLASRDGVDALLTLGGSSIADVLGGPGDGAVPADARILVPLQSQEVWAAGVTYERSRSARKEESGGGDWYDHVYTADRPELFFKAPAGRVRASGERIGIRADSGWDVPEPELVLIADSAARIVAYAVGNDVSSRSIEGENPLYLPQAKLYRGSCALGPALVPVEHAPPYAELTIRLVIERGGAELFADSVPLTAMRRRPQELVDWLFRALDFPLGAALLTGTSIVPPPELTLAADDVVTIDIDGIGRLRNSVEVV